MLVWRVLTLALLAMSAACSTKSSTPQTPEASVPDQRDADPGSSAAGGSDGNVNPVTPTAVGGSDAGATGLHDTNADTGASAPDAAQPEDPKPVDAALDGLVPTSSRWLLFTEIQGAFAPTQLMLVDLDSMQRHLVNPKGTVIAYSTWSPDGRTLLTSGANADSDRELFVVRLTKSGFVPAAPVTGIGVSSFRVHMKAGRREDFCCS